MSEPLTPTAHVPEANKHLMFTIPFTDYAPRFTASSAYSTWKTWPSGLKTGII